MSMKELENLNIRKNNFFRDQYRRLIKFMIMSLLVCFGLLVALFFLIFTQSKPKYYASTTTGTIVPIQSLSSPVVTQKYILQWSKKVARLVYNLDFLNNEEELKNASTYFTQEGWQSLQKSIEKSGLLSTIKQKKLMLSSVVDGSPVILNQYIEGGRYTWKVQLPLLILFGSASESKKKKIYISMIVKRVPELEIARGIAVTSFNVSG